MVKEFSFLRVVLISIIFLHHISLYHGGGAIAVTVFFILSGFCSAITYKDKVLSSGFNYKKYIFNRAVKYYPMHWLTLVMFVVLFGSGIYYKTLLLNASLLQSWIPKMSYYFSYNAVSWYLSDTIFFVAVLPFVLRLLVKLSNKKLLLTTGLLSLLYIIIFIFLPREYYHRILYINPLIRLMDFVMGVISGLFYTRVNYIKISSLSYIIIGVLSFLILIGLSVVIPSDFLSVSIVFWPCSISIVCSIANLNGKVPILNRPIFLFLGKCSFAFFMLHTICIQVANNYADKFIIEKNFIFYAVLFILTWIISIFAQYCYNNPLLKWVSKIKNRQFTIVQS